MKEAPRLVQAAVFATSSDQRFAFMPLMRKQVLAAKAINHIVDGDKAPTAVFRKDKDDPSNRALAELWQAMVKAVRASWSGDRGLGAET